MATKITLINHTIGRKDDLDMGAFRLHDPLEVRACPRGVQLFESASDPQIDIKSLEKFRENFSQIARGLSGLLNSCVVVAGGSIVRVLKSLDDRSVVEIYHNTIEPGDIDVFFVTSRPEEALHNMSRIAQVLKADWSPGKHVLHVSYENVKYDIIMRAYQSIYELLSDFDLPSCRFLFDGTDIWTLPSGLTALIHGQNWVYRQDLPKLASRNLAERLIKYAYRGFGVRLIGFDITDRYKKIQQKWPFDVKEIRDAEGLQKILMASVYWEAGREIAFYEMDICFFLKRIVPQRSSYHSCYCSEGGPMSVLSAEDLEDDKHDIQTRNSAWKEAEDWVMHNMHHKMTREVPADVLAQWLDDANAVSTQ